MKCNRILLQNNKEYPRTTCSSHTVMLFLWALIPSPVQATDKRQLWDRRLIVIVCPLLIIHAVCLSPHPENKRSAFVPGLEGGWEGGFKCFLSLCAPRVTKSTTDGGPDKRSRDWSFLPSPQRSWHWHSHWHTWYFQPPVVLRFLVIPFLSALRNNF